MTDKYAELRAALKNPRYVGRPTLPMALGRLEWDDYANRLKFESMRTVIDCNVEVWGKAQIDEYVDQLKEDAFSLLKDLDALLAERDALRLALEQVVEAGTSTEPIRIGDAYDSERGWIDVETVHLCAEIARAALGEQQ